MGRGGHFAYECRSRLAGDRPIAQRPEALSPTQQPVVKKEQTRPSRSEWDVSEVTCFNCRKKGHISPQCPSHKTKVKRIKIPAERLVALRKNEEFGCINECQVPVTLDTGADVTVVPFECVSPHQFTGESCELNSFNHEKSMGQVCNIQVSVEGKTLERKAVTQPGKRLGWSVCFSLDLSERAERDLLLQQMQARAEMTEEDTWYLPPEVRDGELFVGGTS